MRLRSLVFIAAVSYTLVIGGSLLCYRILIVYPELQHSTLELHNTDLQAVYAAYSAQRRDLSRFTLDWAKWDEPYGFIANGDPGFIKRNLSGSFYQADIDGVAFMDLKGKIHWAGIKDGDQFLQVNTLKALSPDLDMDSLTTKDNQFGFVRLNGKLGYFASNFIQDSEEEYPTNGVLVFIRIIKDSFYNQLSLISNADYRLYEKSEFEAGHADIEPLSGDSRYQIQTLDTNYYIWLENHSLEPIAVMHIDYPSNAIPQRLDAATMFSIAALLMLPIFITMVIWVIFLEPVAEMFNQLRSMTKEGRPKPIQNTSHISEFIAFSDTFNELVNKINRYQQKLEADSQTDGLTGVYNRRHFDTAFDQSWRLSSRNSLPLAIIMMDIDYFKKFNDRYGHQRGDDALKMVADTLSHHTRRAFDILARYGGEEFVMLCQPDNLVRLQELLEEILTSIRDLKIEHADSDVSPHLTISCGACLIVHPGAWMKDHKELALKMADQALYKAKNKGRNQYYISEFDPSYYSENQSA